MYAINDIQVGPQRVCAKVEKSMVQLEFRASRIGQTYMFKVRYTRNSHSSTMDSAIEDQAQAKSTLIRECIKYKYTFAKTVYTPIDIINDMSSTNGLTL